MLERIANLPLGIDGVKAVGRVSQASRGGEIRRRGVAEHFVEAEIQNFGHEKLEDAIGWARGS